MSERKQVENFKAKPDTQSLNAIAEPGLFSAGKNKEKKKTDSSCRFCDWTFSRCNDFSGKKQTGRISHLCVSVVPEVEVTAALVLKILVLVGLVFIIIFVVCVIELVAEAGRGAVLVLLFILFSLTDATF